jgi:hypothetical protein
MRVNSSFGTRDSILTEWKFIEGLRPYPDTQELPRKLTQNAGLIFSIENVEKELGLRPRVTIQISIKAKGDFTKPNKKLPKGRKPQQIYYNLSILTLRSDGYLIDSRRVA